MQSRSKPSAPTPATPGGDRPADERALQDWLTAGEAAGADGLPSWLNADLSDTGVDHAGTPAAEPAPTLTGAIAVAPPPRTAPVPTAPVAATLPAVRPTPAAVRAPAGPPLGAEAPPQPRLRVALSKPPYVEIHQPAYFLVQVSNPGVLPVDGLTIAFPPAPEWAYPEHVADGIVLGRIASGATKRFRLPATPLQGGAVPLSFTLLGAGNLRAPGRFTITVRDTTLRLTLKVPADMRLDHDMEITVGVTNPAAQATGAVFVRLPVPEGLGLLTAGEGGMFDTASRLLQWRFPGLDGGATRNFTARLRAEAPGSFALHLAAESAGRVVHPVQSTLRVDLAPEESGQRLEELIDALDRDIVRAVQEQAGRLHWPARPLPEVGTENRYVLFSTGGVDCAVPLGQVLEIGQPHAVTPVPNVPDWVLGVANVRGDIVSIVDLGRFLDVTPAGATRGPVLLVRARGEELTTGLVVERVRGIRTVARDQFLAAAGTVPGQVRPWADCIAALDARPTVVLDLERLLLSPEMRL